MINIKQSMSKFARGGYQTVRHLLSDHSGAAMVFMAFAAIPLVGLVGVGTDAARGYLVKSKLSSALDAAALAGGRNFFLASRDDDIRMFFNANFPAGYLGSTITGPDITADVVNEKLFVTASASVNTSFMRVLGFETFDVSAATEVTRALQALDIVLAIDLSGSMGSGAPGGGTRIAAARNAATELVNILFGSEATKDFLNIALVPWNGKVNITQNGTTFDAAMTTSQPVASFINPETGAVQNELFFVNNSPVPLLSAPPANWQGCVFSRYADDIESDNDADTLYPALSVGGTDWVAWAPIGPEGEPVSGGTCSLAHPSSGECRRCLDVGITPLQNAKTPIQEAIDDLVGPTGTTNITQGLGWAWRVLKPTAPYTEAELDPPHARQQAIVLLSDGENFAGSGDGYKTVFGAGSSARPDMDARLLELAANIKADNTLIYVIQFANGGSDLQTLLRQVASGDESPYYHYAPNAATLQDVFIEVANHLSELRLSK